MRTPTSTYHKAIVISVGIATGLVGCGGPPVNNTASSDNPIVSLAKDPSLPLLLLVRKQPDGSWCPTKVVSISEEQCEAGAPADQDHVACRFPKDPIRWSAHDEESHANPGAKADFAISFGKNDDPVERTNSFGTTCDKSEDGMLDCKIKGKVNGKTPVGPYKYTVTMTNSPNCAALDPRIYINPSL